MPCAALRPTRLYHLPVSTPDPRHDQTSQSQQRHALKERTLNLDLLENNIMKKTIVIAAVAGLALASGIAYAQMQHPGMQSPMMQGQMPHGMMGQGKGHPGVGHGASTATRGDRGPSSLAFQAINAKMHEGMNITFTGNADADFVKGMIPHHQGAIDMAKTVIAFGKDPTVRKLAEEIVKAQEGEIALLQEWLKKNER
jgi:uncharacterized protein (DUF305 family)